MSKVRAAIFGIGVGVVVGLLIPGGVADWRWWASVVTLNVLHQVAR